MPENKSTRKKTPTAAAKSVGSSKPDILSRNNPKRKEALERSKEKKEASREKSR